MVAAAPIQSIPCAWLQPLPAGFRIPLWRWLLLPAVTWMIKRSNGTWVSGNLDLSSDDLSFSQVKAGRKREPAIAFSFPLRDILSIELTPAFASERLNIHTATRSATFLVVKSSDFIADLRQRTSTLSENN